LWDALSKPEFTRQYWFGSHQESGWKAGSSWKLIFPDGRLADSAEVVEIDPPRRLVLKWRNEFQPELKAEGYTRCIFQSSAKTRWPSSPSPMKRTPAQADRCRFERLAARLVEPQVPARTWTGTAGHR
jgi:uncharacterized protein YndB with AHSA1/START domain